MCEYAKCYDFPLDGNAIHLTSYVIYRIHIPTVYDLCIRISTNVQQSIRNSYPPGPFQYPAQRSPSVKLGLFDLLYEMT